MQKIKSLNRDEIKYIAILFMLLNHIASIFTLPNIFIRMIMSGLGNFTAITMCYFLVEGYEYTRSKKNYMRRLVLFAILSQIPYCMAFTKEGIISFCGLNMLFSLSLCFLICVVIEKIHNIALKTVLIVFIMVCAMNCDWGIGAPVFTLLFTWSKKSVAKRKIAFLIPILLFGLYNFIGRYGRVSMINCVFQTVMCIVGMGMAGICILYFYNGEKSEQYTQFSKWFFYIFYPAHLLLLAFIRVLVS